DAAATGYQPPRTPLETAIAAIWAETLNLPRVGIHDNFFDLGGHSLLAAQLLNRINRALEIDLGLRQIFDTPTVDGQALAALNQLAMGAVEEETWFPGERP
ncbi:phosphopantetheine-binding protein, partial [Thiobacillus sp.]|uniref:phosphopantetheine-binding protein n=1 Tax=Thiobacillus sp. TaxID=924 RepID=UPI0025FB8E9B